MNFDRIKGEIKRKYKNQDNFAIAMNMSTTNLNNKLNNKTVMTQSEISRMAELLLIPKEKIHEYFF